MWGGEDFEDNSKQIKAVVRDKAGELINDPESNLKAKPSALMDEPQELSH
jgi:hypothetical protein